MPEPLYRIVYKDDYVSMPYTWKGVLEQLTWWRIAAGLSIVVRVERVSPRA